MYTAINTEIGDGEYKSTNAEMTKEDFEKSLLISNKTAGQDPREDYRGWLRNTLFDLLERAKDGDERS